MHNAKSFSWNKHLKRLIKVYCSLCVWKILYLLIANTVSEISFSKVDLVKYIFLFEKINGVPSAVMWYMEAFLMALFLYPVSYFLFNGGKEGKKVFSFLMLLTFIGGFLIPEANGFFKWISEAFHINMMDITGLYNIIPFRLHSHMLFLFLLGGALSRHAEKIKERILSFKIGKLIPLLLVGVGVFGLMLIKYQTTHSFKWQGIYLSNGYSHVLTIVMAVGIWLSFYMFENKFAHFLGKYVGRYTLGIYYQHFILLFLCSSFLYPYLSNNISFGMNCLKTVMITTICILLTKLLSLIPVVRELVK